MKEKYINPFTDFGFKKIFGTEFNKPLFYVLKNLDKLTSRPKKLQEKIFSQLFEQAEIAHFNKSEHQQYEESLKQYRDLKNVIDTAKDEAREEGREEGKIEEKVEMAKIMKKNQEPLEKIMQYTGLSLEEIKQI